MMNEVFARIPNIGELYYYHTYLFYDEPQIFSCVTKAFQFYLSMLIDSNADLIRWLIVPISQQRLVSAENNNITIRELFTDSEPDFIWDVSNINGNYQMMSILPSQLTDEMLPRYGEFLDYGSIDETPLRDDIKVISFENRRDIMDLSLEVDDGHIREIKCATLSQVLDNSQQLMYAIGFKNGSATGPIPKSIKSACTLSVAGMFAASVGIRLMSDELSDTSFETSLTAALSDFSELFRVSDRPEELKAFLNSQNPRVAMKYKALLKSLLGGNVGIKISNASPNGKTFERHFTTKELAMNLEFINNEINEFTRNETMYGKLVGVSVERNTFEFVSVSEDQIKGKLSPELNVQTFSIPSEVKVVLEETIETDPFTQEEKIAFRLMSLEDIVPEPFDGNN